jgi:hypothetical protein
LSTAPWLKFVVIALLLVTIGALLRFPLRRINGDSEINYNEGWNAYKQALVGKGVPLYAERPEVFTGPTTYPPASFHLIDLIARHHDVVRTGRWVSLVSLLLAGIFVGLVVRELTAGPIIATFSALLYILGIAVFLPDRLAMNDPQLLGEALTTAGFYCYLKGPDKARLLCVSALAFCLAGFTKQNLIAFPAAVALDLLVRSRKKFAIWLGAMILFAGSFTVLTLAVDGRYFLVHLLFHRAYSLDAGLGSITHYYLLTFQGVLLVAIVWTLCRFRSYPVLASAFVFANALACVLAGGDGVDLNIYFNAFGAAVIVCGAALADIDRWNATSPLNCATGRGRGVHGDSTVAVSAALMAALFLCILVSFPDRLREDHAKAKLLSREDAEFRAAADLIKAKPGPALCESQLLCYRAGKPYMFDAYVASDQIKAHRLDQAVVLHLLRSHQFQAVQLNALPEEARPEPAVIVRNRQRFTPEFMDELLQNYRLAMRTSHMLIFVPK